MMLLVRCWGFDTKIVLNFKHFCHSFVEALKNENETKRKTEKEFRFLLLCFFFLGFFVTVRSMETIKI